MLRIQENGNLYKQGQKIRTVMFVVLGVMV